jgi:hypothetical protein
VLQDRMFEPTASWSLPAHLYMVSGWSALCSNLSDPLTCKTDLGLPDRDGTTPADPTSAGFNFGALLTAGDEDDREDGAQRPDYAWTDITYLLYKTTSAGATTSQRAPSQTARTA